MKSRITGHLGPGTNFSGNRVNQELTHKLSPFVDFTLIVNAHGALLMLGRKVTLGQRVIVMNPKNWDECEGEVTYVGAPYAGLARVGIEFTRPAPEFWSLNSPPADWKQS